MCFRKNNSSETKVATESVSRTANPELQKFKDR